MKVHELLPYLHMTVAFKWFDSEKYDWDLKVVTSVNLGISDTEILNKEIVRMQPNPDRYLVDGDTGDTQDASILAATLIIYIK